MPDNKTLYVDTNISDNNIATEIDESEATESNVRLGYLFKTKSGEQLVGTMPVISSSSIKIDPRSEGGTEVFEYTIPKGYHDGSGTVYTGQLKEYTTGDATADEIAENKVAWVNGAKVIGTLDISQAKQEANATEDDIVYGKYAWGNGKKIVGRIPVLYREDKLLKAGQTYTVPYGLSSKNGSIITAAPLDIQTVGDATADDININKTAWVNGVKITGTFDKESQIKKWAKESTATKDKVLSGYTFFSGLYTDTVEGTMEDHTGEDTRVINPGDLFAIPEGYYDGNVSIKAKDLSDATVADATAEQIMENKTAWVNGVKITGTMPYNNTFTQNINADEEFTIPEGYHTGNSKVIGNSLSSQTVADAVAENIYEGKTAWVNGEKITGTMPDAGAVSIILGAGEHYHIPKGYHDGAGNVYAKSIGPETEGSATPSDLLKDKTAWVNGAKITGTMPNNSGAWIELDPGDAYTIPEGYHPGTGMVMAKSIEEATTGTATADDILLSKTAWVNGEKLTGTIELTGNANPAQVMSGYTFYNTDTHTKLTGMLVMDGSATDDQVVKGATFYTDDPLTIHTGTLELTGDTPDEFVVAGYTFYTDDPTDKHTGTMSSIDPVTVTLECSEEYHVPVGFHRSSSTIKADTLYNQTRANATAKDVLDGKTAWVNGTKITGVIPIQTSVTKTLKAGEHISFNAGYYDTGFTITAQDLASQTQGSATEEDIVIDKTAWVNGVQLTGVIPDGDSMTF